MTATSREIYQRHRLTVRDYQRMGEAGIFHEDDRVELIEGEIVDMAPIGSGHSGQVNRLSNILKLAIGERAIVAVQNPIVLGDHSSPQPDIAQLRPQADYYAAAHPQARDVLLIVEVAESSLDYDRAWLCGNDEDSTESAATNSHRLSTYCGFLSLRR